MTRFSSLLGSVALVALCISVNAQEKDTKGVNPLSVREISDADIMMKRTLWRRLDLREKQNQPMFSVGNEITKYIMDAVKAGLLDAYVDAEMTKKMGTSDFSKALQMPNQGQTMTEEELKAGFGTENAAQTGDGWGDPKKDDKKTAKPADDGWGATAPKKETQPVDDGWGTPVPKKKTTTKGKKGIAAVPPKPQIDSTEIKKKMAEEAAAIAAAAAAKMEENQWFAKDVAILEMKEDWIFDRKRSRLVYDIQTITLVLPSELNPGGIEKPIATFKYKDLDKLFRSDPKKFIWFNEYNTAQHKNLADAFDLRLFNGRIIKTSNPMDRDLITIYGGEKEALWKSVQLENELMELEHGLWEY